MDLLFGETRKTTVMSNNDLELLSINKKHFTKVFFHEFREIGSEIYKNALKRKLRAAKIHKEAVEYCKRENINQNSFNLKRNSFFKKRKNIPFQPQISIAKDFSSSLKESEVFNSYKPFFNKESFYDPKKNEKHLSPLLNPIRFKKPEEKDQISSNSNGTNQNIGSHEKVESFIASPPLFNKYRNHKQNKGNYYEKFTNMLANTPLIAKNYIPFDLYSEGNKNEKNEQFFKKIDLLQNKVEKMDKNMEELIKVFEEINKNL